PEGLHDLPRLLAHAAERRPDADAEARLLEGLAARRVLGFLPGLDEPLGNPEERETERRSARVDEQHLDAARTRSAHETAGRDHRATCLATGRRTANRRATGGEPGPFPTPKRRSLRTTHGRPHKEDAPPLAYALLPLSSMDALPRDIIHSIREGLGMSRAEFARALGWAPSTIARWESGKVEPSRLSLKIILAYGEEHGVRYRPRRAPSMALLLPGQEEPRALALRPLHSEGAVSVVEMDAPPRPRSLSVGLERPGWEAELHFRVAGRDRQPTGRRHSGWIGPVTLIGASLCVILAAGI